jgi:hypothetical protein
MNLQKQDDELKRQVEVLKRQEFKESQLVSFGFVLHQILFTLECGACQGCQLGGPTRKSFVVEC